jgi:hypothetical protein
MKPIHLFAGILLLATLTGCSEKEPEQTEQPKRQRPPVSEIKGTELARIKLPADGEDFEYALELDESVEYVYVDLEAENAGENCQGEIELIIRHSSGESDPLCRIKWQLSNWIESDELTERYVRFVEHTGPYEISGTSWYETGGDVYLVVKDITENVKEYDASAVTNIEEAVFVLRESDHYYKASSYLEKYLYRSPDPFNTSVELFPQFFKPSVTIQSNDFIDDQYAVLKLNFHPHSLPKVGGTIKGGVLINGTNQVVVFGGPRYAINLTSHLDPAGNNTIQPFWTLTQQEPADTEEQHLSTSSWYGEPVDIPDTSKRLILRVEGETY